jgi:hypothetical protein
MTTITSIGRKHHLFVEQPLQITTSRMLSRLHLIIIRTQELICQRGAVLASHLKKNIVFICTRLGFKSNLRPTVRADQSLRLRILKTRMQIEDLWTESWEETMNLTMQEAKITTVSKFNLVTNLDSL